MKRLVTQIERMEEFFVKNLCRFLILYFQINGIFRYIAYLADDCAVYRYSFAIFPLPIYDLCTSSAKVLRTFREITVGDYRDYQLRHGPFRFLCEAGVTRFALISTRLPARTRFHAPLRLRERRDRAADSRARSIAGARHADRSENARDRSVGRRCIVTASLSDNTIAGSRTRPMGRGGQSAATIPLVGQPDPLPHAPTWTILSFSHLLYIHNHKTARSPRA